MGADSADCVEQRGRGFMTEDKPEAVEDGRAWIEIDLDALAHNAAELRSHMPSGCELMAVVKAEAYGHGSVMVAGRLFEEGVKSFAVATAEEGILLRESGLDGEILVLGYTAPENAGLLRTYRLMQLIFDVDYARQLDETGCKLQAHIAIDTGMHRLGIDFSDLTALETVFKCGNLIIEGCATHLASSDTLDSGDVIFTCGQIEKFESTISALKTMGFNTGKLHFQASYGMLNYQNLRCDYARAGIALYGVLSHDEATAVRPALRPVLSLKARIAQVRWIGAGETVSYGRTFMAAAPMKLATVCAGYADGVPRQMSGNGGMCVVHGHKVPIIGRICMDWLMADVTGVDHVQPGDIATLIGSDGGAEIRCEEVAAAAGTITNDILCRFGIRLPRIYKGRKPEGAGR